MLKQIVSLVIIYFGRPRLGATAKKLYNISDCWSGVLLNFVFLYKGQELASSHILFMIFQENYFSCYIILIYQISFTSWDVRQYVL